MYNDLKFWRTSDEKYEIDFVLESENKVYEFKYKDKIKESDFRWLNKFSSLYPNFVVKILCKEDFDI